MGYWIIGSSGLDLSIALIEAIGRIALVIGIMVIAFFAIALHFLKVHELYGSGDSSPPNQQTNYPSCGARISFDEVTCEYCVEPIDG